ncbi:MAG TPA: ATP-binding protein [Gemmatimonadales bacterium]|nr:ATP-binding protein [Gemmatimonadales bacterium]
MTAIELSGVVERLRNHPIVGSAPLPELEWIAAHGYLRRFSPGEYVIRKGQEQGTLGMVILLTGHLVLYVDRGRGSGGRRKLAEWRGGEVSGVLPYSRVTSAIGDGVVEVDTEIWMVDREWFPEMIRACPELTAILVHVMLDRARQFTSAELRDEKLLALGKLAAGLAHELNNPASAMVRSAKVLGDLLDQGEAAAHALGALGLDATQMAGLQAVRDACWAAPVRTWSPLERADREEHFAAWIEARGGDAGLAAPLAETAVALDVLEGLAGVVPDAALDVALRWIAGGCAVRGLRQEIERGAARIFELVSAVKGFTQMDRTPDAQPVDVRRSLHDTIIVLRSKAASRSASLVADVPVDLPAVQGVGAELNQIWANLVDNALDAVGPGGHVVVSARREGNRIVVEVTDDGPGIPADIRERIFEPFFSTKDVGKGVGLGLDLVRRTLERHDGEIDVESRPGRTVFRVRLPAEGMRSGGRWSRSSSRIQVEHEE